MTAEAQRSLAWDGCLNVRDLGGHPTADGGETRFGAFVRADSIRLLSDDGWRSLLGYGVKTVIDLRTDIERAEDPPADVPVEVIHIDLVEPDEDVQRRADAASRAAPDDATSTRDVYLIFLERFRANFARVVTEAARAGDDGPVLIHCVGGKDRTGLISALLLRIAGVPEDEVAADYAVSEERLRPRHDRWLASAETEAERERLRRISVTPAAAMAGVLDELDRRYGGVDAYLRAGGATEEDLAAVRRRLRG